VIAMNARMLKRVAARLPQQWQHELRRRHFRRQIRDGCFTTDEREFALLDTFLGPADWAVDVGANVGHYTMRMSDLVGAAGRIIALEPVSETFAILADNVRLFENGNVSLLNVAASDATACFGLAIPRFPNGLTNYYQAHLTANDHPEADGATGSFRSVLALALDELRLPTIKLVKIDAEGHELPVLLGMRELMRRDHPVLIVETGAADTIELLREFGYRTERLPGSSNVLCRFA
jgi:FkbM family methyltransferase